LVPFASQKLLIDDNRTKSHVIKVIEGFETVMFKSKFVEWPPTPDLKLSSEDGRGKVAGYCLHIIISSARYIYKAKLNAFYYFFLQLSLKVKD
jgi:hypothetical protein